MSSLWVFATHNRAGEITFRHLGGLRYQITVITYTETSPGGNQADRPFLPIDWGDNSGRDSIERNSIVAESAFIQKNTYIKSHEYAGPGSFIISVEDPNRNANVQNIPNSVNVVFYIETELIIDPFAGHNNSVQLLNPPIDFACVGNVFVHNPSAFDPDGDSLSYQLVASKGFNGVVIPGYTFPSATNSISINPRTGQLIWDTPKFAGEYNVAILVTEYKNGIPVGSVLRDMQITVTPPCNHKPPVIEGLEDSYCVTAGDSILLNFRARDDGDGSQQADGAKVILEVTSGLLEPPPKAVFSQSSQSIIVNGSFYWETICKDVRINPYSLVVRAVDDGNPNLSSFKSVDIRVIAPAIENIAAEPVKNQINVSWDKSICEEAIGYKLYRRLGSSGYLPDTCETGIPSDLGFDLIADVGSVDSLSFADDDDGEGLIPGLQYCYRIFAYFEDGSESQLSEEVCVRLRKELPVLTNVSVELTSPDTGRMYVAWSKPTEHDTILYPGPYKYEVRRKIWEEDFIEIATKQGINDTILIDSLLNTTDNEYTYIIDMYDLSSGETLMGSSVSASSIYLNSLAQDNALELQWSENVPWINDEYVLYKRDENGVFNVLDTVKVGQNYTDDSLTNGAEYCYRLESIGGYLTDGYVDPIINFSQIHCNEPIDTVGPCPPVLTVEAVSCQTDVLSEDGSKKEIAPCGEDGKDVETFLSWTNPMNSCPGVDDVVRYDLYFRPSLNDPFSVIHTTMDPTDTTYTHKLTNENIAGCYYIAAIDSFGNRSPLVDTVCVDNCPYYVLPNVFTPGNKDGINDIFRPFPYCFIDEIEITIFSRWGRVVFETNDPDINWDGNIQSSGAPASVGVYYYVCKLYENRLNGQTQKVLKGYVQLLRKNQ